MSAFGGDQFVVPQQERYLAMFFSIFYFSINTGSLISTILTPMIRETKCFGGECYFVAFLVPAVLMILSIGENEKNMKHISHPYRCNLINEDLFLVIFISGKRMYKIVSPTGNLIVKVSKCVYVSRISSKSHFKHFKNYKTNKNYLQTIIHICIITKQIII